MGRAATRLRAGKRFRARYGCWVCCLLCLASYSLSTAAEWHSDHQAIMGTSVNVTLWHEDSAVAARGISEVMQEMHRINNTFSPYKAQSDLSIINRSAAKHPQALTREMAFLLQRSLYFSEISDGAFDITFASVGHLYDYRNKVQPNSSSRASLLPAINYRHITLDTVANTVAFAHANVVIDLGGIAKGYAVDRAIEKLAALGIQHASVSAGGDSRVLGDKRGRPWIVGIKNPRQQPGQPETVIRMPLEDAAISTSGDYERYFIDEQSGERIHHILNPKTGESAKGVVSVTILGSRGVDTDPLSTTVFVLGVEKGLALLNSLTEFDGVIIDSAGVAHYSSGLVAPNVN